MGPVLNTATEKHVYTRKVRYAVVELRVVEQTVKACYFSLVSKLLSFVLYLEVHFVLIQH